MRFSPKRTQSVAVIVASAVAIILVLVFVGYRIRRRIASQSASALLQRADDLFWNGQWVEAEPLYQQAEIAFAAKGDRAKALYARVSRIPARAESVSLSAAIYVLTQDLNRPEGADPETRLRILVVRGIIENNYDAGFARETWRETAALARKQGHFLLASRALGEEGIADFLVGDTAAAKRDVLTAWGISKIFRDPAAQVRYASLYGAGLVELHRYGQALVPLDDAIGTVKSHPEVAFPAVAVSYKIDALRGLGRDQEALSLAAQALAQIPNSSFKGHYYQLFTTRAAIYEDMGRWDRAIEDLRQALVWATQLEYWRGITQVAGKLAEAYEHENNLNEALSAVDQAIEANKRIPDELYFVPRDLAIKARILTKLGHPDQAEVLYRKSAILIDSLLENVPTREIERVLLSEMSEVYSGYFVLTSKQHEYDEALRVLEEARGRIEAQTLEHHKYVEPHAATPAERELTELNMAVLDTNDPAKSQELTDQIHRAELMTDQGSLASATIEHPVRLRDLESSLKEGEVLIEYVLTAPHSYALAVTRSSRRVYELPEKERIEADAEEYRASIRNQQKDSDLGKTLFDELLAPISELRDHSTLILVPDGMLHLLPFGALQDQDVPLVETHTVAICPSATVLSILRSQRHEEPKPPLPYVGVAAWVREAKTEGPILRAFSGFTDASLQPLPESKTEVETIAADLPRPSAILLGADATETRFKQLPLANFDVIHLALHGYVDTDFPDRSALIFAPTHDGVNDGMLQVREIRNLHLNARLVTLSACNTGVGPVGEDGVANIVNAFIEAGANSVVSTLWELEDHSTEHLMAEFYARLGRGEEKGQALREAQHQLIKEGFQPYYWASFELVGDPSGTI